MLKTKSGGVSLLLMITLLAVVIAGTELQQPQREGGWKMGGIPAETAKAIKPAPRLSRPEPLRTTRGVVKDATSQKDLDTGEVRRIRGQIPVEGAQTPEEAADKFLTENAALLGISTLLTRGSSGLRVVQSKKSLTGTHLTYGQFISNLPVFDSFLLVQVNNKLAVTAVNQDLSPIRSKREIAEPHDPQSAIKLALDEIKPVNPPLAEPEATAGILPSKSETPIVVWRVRFTTTKPAGSWEVLVDANSRKVISVTNLALYATGKAWVFIPNPVNSSGNAALTNGQESDLDKQRTEVTLEELDATGFLQGRFATTAPTAKIFNRAFEPTRVFDYRSSDRRFDEVMAYYWISESERYIQSLGFTNINDRQLKIVVDGIDDDQSFYDPGTGSIVFGAGGVHDAQDAEIVMHETGHSIQDSEVTGFGHSYEAGAMGEGFGDYWAGSYFAGIGPKGHGWDVYIGTWDATAYNPGKPAFLRRLDSAKTYPQDMAPEKGEDRGVHANGEIWSACLWQIRGITGRKRADTMILESHFALSPNSTFADAAQAILQANRDLYQGVDEAAIRQVFVTRGIL